MARCQPGDPQDLLCRVAAALVGGIPVTPNAGALSLVACVAELLACQCRSGSFLVDPSTQDTVRG